MNHAEYNRISAYAERQRHRGRDGKAKAVPEEPVADDDVPKEGSHRQPRQAPR